MRWTELCAFAIFAKFFACFIQETARFGKRFDGLAGLFSIDTH